MVERREKRRWNECVRKENSPTLNILREKQAIKVKHFPIQNHSLE